MIPAYFAAILIFELTLGFWLLVKSLQTAVGE
jgi:hypothetical protein